MMYNLREFVFWAEPGVKTLRDPTLQRVRRTPHTQSAAIEHVRVDHRRPNIRVTNEPAPSEHRIRIRAGASQRSAGVRGALANADPSGSALSSSFRRFPQFS